MTYLYTPPTWRNVQVMEGALRYGVPTSTVVYRQAGVWHNVQIAGVDQPVVLACDVDSSGLRLFFSTPTPVPDSLFAELSAVAPADPSWTPGVLTPL
jgi:hypothetical protein